MTVRTRTTAALLGAGLVTALTACGSSGGGGATHSGPDTPGTTGHPSSAAAAAVHHGEVGGPCDVTDRATVSSVFAGAGAGRPGEVRNCNYPLPSGAIASVNVFWFGTSADWSAEKAQAAQYAGPLKDVPVGDGAYFAKGDISLTVKAGGIVFGVQVLPRDGLARSFYPAHETDLEALARKIAAQH